MGAFTVVFLATKLLLPVSLEVCILLGAIASATAPASPVAVIQELGAKGPLTETLLAVVALDDAACLIIFGLAAAMVNILTTGGNNLLLFLLPVWEILGSIGAGVAVGWLILQLLKRIRNRHEIVIVLIGISFLAGELAELIALSALLLNMTSGVVIANFHTRSNVFHILEEVELPVFVVFFTLAGASLDIKMLLLNFGLVVVYIIARAVGKVGGAFLGAGLSNAPPPVKKYLGFAMLSQAGVAIALVMAVQSRFPQYGTLINAIILAAVTFNELIGPVGTKYALTSAAEIGKEQIPST
jgi:Kef-type K+ transport system membrane component KefB